MSYEYYMSQAMKMAQMAFDQNEVPVGAIVVKNGEIIGKGFNTVIKDQSVSSHAEINAIDEASNKLRNYRLINCDIYVTLEPCHMCAKAIVDARFSNLYFAITEPKTGAIVSIDNFLDSKHLNHKVNYSYGMLANDSESLLKLFFSTRR